MKIAVRHHGWGGGGGKQRRIRGRKFKRSQLGCDGLARYDWRTTQQARRNKILGG